MYHFMNKYFIIGLAVVIFIITFVSCGKFPKAEQNNTFEQISAAEAKALMETEKNYIILDVRTPEEFSQEHIKDAILIPDYEISEKAEKQLADKNQLILVYCRSGRRSKLACKELTKLGYTNIKEFGGIIDWPYDTVSE